MSAVVEFVDGGLWFVNQGHWRQLMERMQEMASDPAMRLKLEQTYLMHGNTMTSGPLTA